MLGPGQQCYNQVQVYIYCHMVTSTGPADIFSFAFCMPCNCFANWPRISKKTFLEKSDNVPRVVNVLPLLSCTEEMFPCP